MVGGRFTFPDFFHFFFLFRVAPKKFFFHCSPYGESQVVRYSVHKLRGMSASHWPKILTCLSLEVRDPVYFCLVLVSSRIRLS